MKQKKDTLVVANYMEPHAPFSPPVDAIKQFNNMPLSDLPVGERGQKIREQYQSDPEYDAEDMYTLYKASIWDLDRKVTPLISELISEDTMVIVTADHGNWFRINNAMEESRIHVPLVIFTPETRGEYINHTVNLRHIARTTTDFLQKNSPRIENLPGTNLLDVNSDLISITEFLYNRKIGNLEKQPVLPKGLEESDDVYYYVSGIKGESKINYYAGEEEYETIRGNGEELEKLRTKLQNHTDREINLGTASRLQYNPETEERLRQLGYIN